jgi:hypothetical protein
MPTDPHHGAPIEVGLEAMGHLRAANHLLAEAYRHAADDVGENYVQRDDRRRDNRHVYAVAEAWAAAELEFRRACMRVAPTIEASLRLADVESIGEQFLKLTSRNNPVSIAEVTAFDQHIHELFEELQRQWPELENQPPLAERDEDDLALRPSWRLALEQRPLRLIFTFGMIIWVVGSILWMVVSSG